MSTDGSQATGEKKTRAAAEKAVEKIFKTREEAQAEMPAGAKRLCVFKVNVPKAGEAFVIAGNDSAAINLVARLAVGMTAESTRVKKAAGAVSLKSKLSEILAEADGCKTKEAQELVSKIKNLQQELEAARAAKKAASEGTTTAPAVPPVPPAVPAA